MKQFSSLMKITLHCFEGKLDTLLKLGENDLENENYRDAKYNSNMS